MPMQALRNNRDAHTPAQMKQIREENAKAVEKEMRERVPEALQKSHLCDVRIERYTTTDLKGMFEVTMHVYKNGKKIEVKKVIKGVYFNEMVEALEKALHWRTYDMR